MGFFNSFCLPPEAPQPVIDGSRGGDKKLFGRTNFHLYFLSTSIMAFVFVGYLIVKILSSFLGQRRMHHVPLDRQIKSKTLCDWIIYVHLCLSPSFLNCLGSIVRRKAELWVRPKAVILHHGEPFGGRHQGFEGKAGYREGSESLRRPSLHYQHPQPHPKCLFPAVSYIINIGGGAQGGL